MGSRIHLRAFRSDGLNFHGVDETTLAGVGIANPLKSVRILRIHLSSLREPGFRHRTQGHPGHGNPFEELLGRVRQLSPGPFERDETDVSALGSLQEIPENNLTDFRLFALDRRGRSRVDLLRATRESGDDHHQASTHER